MKRLRGMEHHTNIKLKNKTIQHKKPKSKREVYTVNYSSDLLFHLI